MGPNRSVLTGPRNFSSQLIAQLRCKAEHNAVQQFCRAPLWRPLLCPDGVLTGAPEGLLALAENVDIAGFYNKDCR